LPDSNVRAVIAKASKYEELSESRQLRDAKGLCDAWCAAAILQKTGASSVVTTSVLRRLAINPGRVIAEAAEVAHLAIGHRFFHWPLEFPEVFSHGQAGARSASGFDAVIGNPPFVNSIEGGIGKSERRFLRMRHPSLGGTADLAYYFLAAATQLTAPSGRIGLVQPRAVLNAGSLKQFRASPPAGLSPSLIYAPDFAGFFPGAAVFICLLGLARDGEARVSIDAEPNSATWRSTPVRGDNWWLAISANSRAAAEPIGRGRIADEFQVYASMFVQEAYEATQYIVDDAAAAGPKLITTGLIDPGVNRWGEVPCRYLKTVYGHPRLVLGAEASKTLRTKVELAGRPKIIVAGLGKRIECFVDTAGECIGVVSTYTILDRDDDVTRLRVLCDWLLSEPLSVRFRDELGGNAMGGGNTTMRRDFLAQLPLPT
jgi:hypothetical protein